MPKVKRRHSDSSCISILHLPVANGIQTLTLGIMDYLEYIGLHFSTKALNHLKWIEVGIFVLVLESKGKGYFVRRKEI
jgi:hypothetical protein